MFLLIDQFDLLKDWKKFDSTQEGSWKAEIDDNVELLLKAKKVLENHDHWCIKQEE